MYSAKIVNDFHTDYHMHTSNFSDGLNTIDEMVIHAGKIGLTEIAITDHSQVLIDKFRKDCNFMAGSSARWSLHTWKNVHNDVNVLWGVEGDLINEDGDVCFHIQEREPDFIILSAHKFLYRSDPDTVTKGTIKAIERRHEKIKFIGHPCNNNDFGNYYNIKELAEVANEYAIPLEINAKCLLRGKTNVDKLPLMLESANQLYFNSDAHGLYELQEAKPYAQKYLVEKGYL